jgi:hypothetical protein
VTTAKVTSFVATTWVRDLEVSRLFYGALGFTEQLSGANPASAWSSLRQGDHLILLATSQPPLDVPRFPLLFYFWVDDLDRACAALAAIGHEVAHVGYPPHALGGEARTTDPDGNTVLIGQAVHAGGAAAVPEDDPAQRFSLLREAAALAAHREGAQMTCQLPDSDGRLCAGPAEVKLADSWGETAWACLPHAEAALINAPAAFIASPDDRGLASLRRVRR